MKEPTDEETLKEPVKVKITYSMFGKECELFDYQFGYDEKDDSLKTKDAHIPEAVITGLGIDIIKPIHGFTDAVFKVIEGLCLTAMGESDDED